MADRHLDRRQVLRALLLAGAGLAVPAACGVPTGGGPIVDGAGPVYDPAGGNKVPLPDPADATSAKNLVELFLYAVSGPLDSTDLFNAARERARKFLTREAGNAWKPADAVTVVRVDGLTSSISGSNTVVSGTLQPVGVLAPDRGLVGPPTGGTAPTQVKFVVSPAEDGAGLRISELPALPNGFPLAADALDNKYFTPQLLYFWDTTKHWLVPDLRYVPRTSLADSARLATIVKWLLGGPSELISSVVAPSIFPSGTDLDVPNVVVQVDRVVVNFSAALQGVSGADLGNVLAQVQWSLQPLHRLTTGPVELRIAGQRQQTDSSADLYKRVNPADDVVRAVEAQPFCVTGNVVEALDGTLPVVLAKPEHNKNVSMAALSRDGHAAALVTTAKRLMVGRVDNDTVSYLTANLTGTAWSRPAWLPSGRRLLVIVDSARVAVSATGAVSTPLATDVTAFAVAPDGYRIALVRHGVVAVGPLRDDGDQPSLSGPLRPLDAGLSDLTGVAWSRLDRLVVAGRTDPNQFRLAEITIDGAIRDVWSTTFSVPIVSVVAYPKLPSQAPGPGPVMVQTQDGTAYRVFGNTSSSTSQPDRLTGRDPAPGASPSGTPAKKPTPTAPFYPD
jgi:hypothetical protein